MASIEGFLEHAVIDGDVSDHQLLLYLNAAMGYLKQAGVQGPSDAEAATWPLEASLYDLAVYQVATHYYEQRGMVGDNVSTEVFGVQGIIHQLSSFFAGPTGGVSEHGARGSGRAEV